MAMHASRGEASLQAGNPSEAIEHYNLALSQNPAAAPWYIKRSTAHQRTSNSLLALQDAETGVLLATKRANRELIASAQLRRGIALFQLERYGDAGFVFGVVERLAGEKTAERNSVTMWKANLGKKVEGLEEGDPRRSVVVKEMPDRQALPESESAPASSSSAQSTATTASDAKADTNGAAVAASAQPTPTPPPTQTQTPHSKIRHDWYQTPENVYLSLLAKGVPKDSTTQIEIHPTSINISFPLATGSTYDFSLDPLFAAVDATASTHRILSTKIEVVLKKAEAGTKWAALEGTGTAANGEGGTAKAAAANGTDEAGPSYPTSSRSGPKNWDKIVQSFTKPPDKHKSSKDDAASDSSSTSDTKADDNGTPSTSTTTPQKPSSSSKPSKHTTKDKDKDDEDIYIDDYEDEGDPANAFFKKLYSGADPDTRRAMMKSYQESGGTALSTNWGEVGKKRTEVTPPEGMVAKKWEI